MSDNFASQPVLMPFEGASGLTGTGTVAIDGTVGRNAATSSIKHASGASGGAAYLNWFWGLQGYFGWYVRRYFQLVGTLPNQGSGVRAKVLELSDNSANVVFAVITDAGKVQLRTDIAAADSQVGSDSALTMVVGRWYYFELYAKYAAGSGDDECALRVGDDTTGVVETVASATAQTFSASMITQAYWGIVNAWDASCQINSRDGAINNDQGSTQNSWAGPCDNVLYSRPTADSARGADWKNGAAGTTSLFDAVDNLPPAGVVDGSSTATSQIKNSNTADATQNYDATMQTYSVAGAATGKYVKVAQQIVIIGSSTTTNVSAGSKIVSTPTQTSEDSWSTGRSAAAGTYGADWSAHWGEAQLFVQDTAPALGTAPVARIGRRGTEAGTLEVCLMAIAIEVAIPTAPPKPLIVPRAGPQRAANW